MAKRKSNSGGATATYANLAIRGIDSGQIAQGDTFHNDRHPDRKADYVLANPLFNDSGWWGDLLKNNPRRVYSAPPAGNANYAWVQRMVQPCAGDETCHARITHRLGAA